MYKLLSEVLTLAPFSNKRLEFIGIFRGLLDAYGYAWAAQLKKLRVYLEQTDRQTDTHTHLFSPLSSVI